MRRFFLITLALSFLAFLLAQPAMKLTPRINHDSQSAPDGADSVFVPEVIATNLPDADTLIGIVPDTRSL